VRDQHGSESSQKEKKMKYLLVTTIEMSRGPKETSHGPFTSRMAVESAAIAAIATARFDRVTIETVEVEKDKEDKD